MGRHGKGIFTQSRANIGHTWKKCKECGRKFYRRYYDERTDAEWKEQTPMCNNCEAILARKRCDRMFELEDQGYSEKEAWKKACDENP